MTEPTAVLRALGELDRVGQTALVLIYWRGHTQAQVASELELPVATVRTVVARSMRELAERILAR